jgi:crotonobetainyl-CoA:carnitine CoA-transferase CaiB-like acyl-CoA transferase
LVDHDVMAAPVKTMRETVQDPQVRHNRMIRPAQHQRLGKIETGALPIRFAGDAELQTRAAPCLGQHTRELLLELGYTASQIEAMIETGAIKSADQ